MAQETGGDSGTRSDGEVAEGKLVISDVGLQYAFLSAAIELCQRTIDYLRMEHHVVGRQMTLAEERELGIAKLQDEIKSAVEQQGNCIKLVAEKVKGE